MSYASSNWSSAEYITNSQNAWMNWSTAPPPQSLPQIPPDPAYNPSTSDVPYGYTPGYTSTSANNDHGLSMCENPGEKKFDTAFAAPAINLGTGDRFSQLLEAKMSLMNAGSGLAQPNGGGIEVQQQSYDYGMQNYPFQPQPQPQPQSQTNPYPLPVSTSTSSTYDSNASTNGYLTPNRFSNMIVSGVPASAGTSNPFIPNMGVNPTPTPLQTPQDQNQNQIQPQFMPDSDTYQIAPPPPPQGDLSDSTTSSSASPRSILSTFLSQRSNININVNQQSYQGTPVYSQQVTPSFDQREVEKHLADWSQVHIQPDLVAPLPASVQDYKRQATPPVVSGDGSRYKYLSSSSTSMEYPQQYPFTYPSSQPSSAQNSFNPSPSVNHLPVSGQTSIRSSHSPTVLSHSIDQTQQRASMTGWTSSQPITPIIASTSSQSILPPVPSQEEEALPPLLKIRMKDSANGAPALPPQPDNLELEPILEWTSTQPALIPKKQSRPKDGHSHKRQEEDEVEIVQREKPLAKEEEKEAKKGRPEKRKRKSTNVVEREDEAGEPKSIKISKVAKPPIEKTIIACNNCRAKKLKCNGEKPKCYHCHRRGEETCLYEAVLRRRGPGKHNKEKKSKSGSSGTGSSKKRKSTRRGDQDGESDSDSGSESDQDQNTEDDEGDTPVKTTTKKSKSRSKRQSTSSSAVPPLATENPAQSQSEERHHYFESFGLGGGGSIGRIDTRRLDESELKNMSYVLNSTSDHNRNEGGPDKGTQGGNLAMGFGGGLNIIDSGSGAMPHLGGIGSRFVTSTARE
ncbi:hypothetical protein I302_103605 [Kwoniella bestiolae CBS 10118]|uniref:Zn(2)-C6 fungal-type domain-containing protein n=1 Tax=Kwoniella bestiolae CBS 10118 TaxID=1296100 RepID=A0A1B9G8V1_9TREE|nr:hypothetical protein I302_02307 [Kwoniella bestiolae CBS 10118]OCF27465.1 hypothetical protein I302_02307 [Kwoniella bestiolae CBS 10118]